MASHDVASQLERGESQLPSDCVSLSKGQTTSTEKILTENVPDCSHFKIMLFGALNLIKSIHLHLSKRSGEALPQRRMKDTRIRRLQDFPNGFPKLSCYLDSDDAFMLYRRFGTVYSRLLLSKQDEMSRMEALLNGMDKQDEAEGNERYLKSCTLDAERETTPDAWRGVSRVQLLEKLEKKALEYAELLLKARELKALDRPSRREYKSVLHFMENDGGPLFEEEAEFIYEKEDLVTLRPGRDHAWLDGVLERLLQICRCRLLLFIFRSKETREKTDDRDIHYYDRDRIRTCTTFLITVMILILLIIPIWLLCKFSTAGTLATSPNYIGVLLVFTLVFSTALSTITRARRHEIIAASAGYCAVLVVFLGNVNNVGNGSP